MHSAPHRQRRLVSPPSDEVQKNSCTFLHTNRPQPIKVNQEGSQSLPCSAPKIPSHLIDPFIIEICAGTARVTSCLQALGLAASFGVDHKRVRNAGRVLLVDLTTPEGQSLCWEWIKSPSCAGVFCAPPCGTCSRARGIPVTLPNGYQVAGPQPLRSDLMPDGLPSMSYLNRCRVRSANTLYKFITEVVQHCLAHDLLVVIENPRSSLYWRTSFFAPIRKKLHFTAHQACAYGSDRPKWTVLAHNTRTISDICKVCPGVSKSHHHKPWGVSVDHNDTRKFSTAEETAYPPMLAYTIAHAIAQELIHKGWKPPPAELVPPESISYQYLRAIVGSQPKASKLPPILSEFASVVRVPVSAACPPCQVGQCLSQPFAEIPAGSKLLKRPPLRLSGVSPGSNNVNNRDLPNNGDKLTHWAYFGIYRSCNEFVDAAVNAGHPVSRANRLPHVLQEAVNAIASKPAFVLAKERHATLSHWLSRAKTLGPSEKELHDSFPEPLGRILAPKRLLLWKEMLVYYGYPDIEVFDEVTAGIHLAGASPPVPSFEPCKNFCWRVSEVSQGVAHGTVENGALLWRC